MNRQHELTGFEKRLDESIKRSGMTVTEVMEKTGLCRQVFYRGEHIHVYTLYQICKVTGASADYILGLR